MSKFTSICLKHQELLYNFCFFYLISPHGNLTSVVKQLCHYVHGYVCTDAAYVYFPKNICEDITASKNI